eukprot:GILK01007203.1.p1 GENE.GILK01007203.1~~GILK01007203.1.p1  ORF type:complete len:703 (+),score=118.58 GILK01007203.1:41-2110(+)
MATSAIGVDALPPRDRANFLSFLVQREGSPDAFYKRANGYSVQRAFMEHFSGENYPLKKQKKRRKRKGASDVSKPPKTPPPPPPMSAHMINGSLRDLSSPGASKANSAPNSRPSTATHRSESTPTAVLDFLHHQQALVEQLVQSQGNNFVLEYNTFRSIVPKPSSRPASASAVVGSEKDENSTPRQHQRPQTSLGVTANGPSNSAREKPLPPFVAPTPTPAPLAPTHPASKASIESPKLQSVMSRPPSANKHSITNMVQSDLNTVLKLKQISRDLATHPSSPRYFSQSVRQFKPETMIDATASDRRPSTAGKPSTAPATSQRRQFKSFDEYMATLIRRKAERRKQEQQDVEQWNRHVDAMGDAVIATEPPKLPIVSLEATTLESSASPRISGRQTRASTSADVVASPKRHALDLTPRGTTIPPLDDTCSVQGSPVSPRQGRDPSTSAGADHPYDSTPPPPHQRHRRASNEVVKIVLDPRSLSPPRTASSRRTRGSPVHRIRTARRQSPNAKTGVDSARNHDGTEGLLAIGSAAGYQQSQEFSEVPLDDEEYDREYNEYVAKTNEYRQRAMAVLSQGEPLLSDQSPAQPVVLPLAASPVSHLPSSSSSPIDVVHVHRNQPQPKQQRKPPVPSTSKGRPLTASGSTSPSKKFLTLHESITGWETDTDPLDPHIDMLKGFAVKTPKGKRMTT